MTGQGKLAARDYEGRLKVNTDSHATHVKTEALTRVVQCFFAPFEALLDIPEDRRIVHNMVFDLATWHALAKLREHTTPTIDGLDSMTVACGAGIRLFAKKTCTNYVTLELPAKDSAARGRRKPALRGKAKGKAPATAGKARTLTERKLKIFNYTTYKFHAMRDYAPAIRWFASIDNFTTQVVSSWTTLTGIYEFLMSPIGRA